MDVNFVAYVFQNKDAPWMPVYWIFENATFADQKRYVCTAENHIARNERIFYLFVEPKSKYLRTGQSGALPQWRCAKNQIIFFKKHQHIHLATSQMPTMVRITSVLSSWV
jgi:hypothetical protein